ncbi:MAG: NAD(P)-dependent oxidoreductase [Clostridia bacterium]|nr:NAD(P)-dependent oxidoreductase [Clostridia bacterium]
MRESIIDEARRCLQCKNPVCRTGCPVNTPIKDAIGLFRENRISDAGKLLFDNNPLSIVCSLVCPQEKQCEGHCVLGVKAIPVPIGLIENYISDYYLNIYEPEKVEKNGIKVAIIGSGPAGITIAVILSRRGYDVTVFEGHDKIGGVMRYGIPEFRLPKSVLDRLKNVLIKCGVKIRPNTNIGSNLTVDDLQRDGYKAIFIGTGVWRPNKLGLKGESFASVSYAMEYLRNPDVYDLGNRVAVIGSGNTAMDVARTVLRHGIREVTLIYRKGEEDVKARKVELDFALIDGAKILFYKGVKEIVEDGLILCDTVKDENGNVSEVEGTEKLFPVDNVIIAAGQGPRSVIVNSTSGINVCNRGFVTVDECGRTTREGIFASGDVVTGAKTVVEAVKVSKRVADAMDEYMQSLVKSEKQ